MMTPTRRTQRVHALAGYVRVLAGERVGVAAHSMPDEFIMRRNAMEKPSYHWNSLIIRNWHRRRILHKHDQHPPCSVLDTARYHILHPNRHNQYPPCAINILPVKSVSSLRNEREIVMQCCRNDSRHFQKPQTEFRIQTNNSKSQNQVPTTWYQMP